MVRWRATAGKRAGAARSPCGHLAGACTVVLVSVAGDFSAVSHRGQVFFWGSTVPPRPYSLPLDGRAVTGERVEFAPLRYVRVPFREIAASRVALLAMTRRNGCALDYTVNYYNNATHTLSITRRYGGYVLSKMIILINLRICLYSLSFRGNGVTVGISRKGNVCNGDRRQFL